MHFAVLCSGVSMGVGGHWGLKPSTPHKKKQQQKLAKLHKAAQNMVVHLDSSTEQDTHNCLWRHQLLGGEHAPISPSCFCMNTQCAHAEPGHCS